MPPFAVRHIDHLVLRVADLERSIAFYRDVASVIRDGRFCCQRGRVVESLRQTNRPGGLVADLVF